MVLISPVAWQHYFLLLLQPLAVAWRGATSKTSRTCFVLALTALWLSPFVIWWGFGLLGHTAGPIHALTLLAYPTYALVALFVLLLSQASKSDGDDRNPLNTSQARVK